MKYTICGYDQEAAGKMVGEREFMLHGKKKTEKIRVKVDDLVLLRWLTWYWRVAKKVEIDGVTYARISSSIIMENLPLLNLSNSGVTCRLCKLRHFGLIEYRSLGKRKNRVCYRVGKEYNKLIYQPTDEPAINV